MAPVALARAARALPLRLTRHVHIPAPPPRTHRPRVRAGALAVTVEAPAHWVPWEQRAMCPVPAVGAPDRGLYVSTGAVDHLAASPTMTTVAVWPAEALVPTAVRGATAEGWARGATVDGVLMAVRGGDGPQPAAYEFAVTLRLSGAPPLRLAFAAPAGCWRGCWIAAGRGMLRSLAVAAEAPAGDGRSEGEGGGALEWALPWDPLPHVPRPRVAAGGAAAACPR